MARKTNTRNKRNTRKTKTPRASNTSIRVYYPYAGEAYEATYNPNTRTINIDGSDMSPTRAAKTVTDGACGSVNGWVAWRFVKDTTIAGQTFSAGASISPARNALDQPIVQRTVNKVVPPDGKATKATRGKGKGKATKTTRGKATRGKGKGTKATKGKGKGPARRPRRK